MYAIVLPPWLVGLAADVADGRLEVARRRVALVAYPLVGLDALLVQEGLPANVADLAPTL